MYHFKILYYFIFALLPLFIVPSYAQDLIVTIENDSLNCRIKKIKSGTVYFTFRHKDEIRKTLLPPDQVRYYQYNYFPTSEVPEDDVAELEHYPHIRAALTGGWSYRTAKLAETIPSQIKNYVNELRSGYHYDLDVSYYFCEHLGIGVKYTIYRSDNEIDGVSATDYNGITYYGKLSNDQSIYFIGPFFSTRLLNSNKRNAFIMNFGIGYLGYSDKGILIDAQTTTQGSCLGLCWDIGYDIALTKNCAVGVQFSWTTGTLTGYEVSNGVTTKKIEFEDDNYENLSRIDLSLGFRFNK